MTKRAYSHVEVDVTIDDLYTNRNIYKKNENSL